MTQHITMAEVIRKWGDSETAVTCIKVTKRWLEWLGRLARVPDCSVPKSAWLVGPATSEWYPHERVDGCDPEGCDP